MISATGRNFLGAALLALATSAALAGAASAGPTWHFENEDLVGTETVGAAALKPYFTIPGLTTSCEEADLQMTIWNSGGIGRGSVTGFPFTECGTDSELCTVETMEAEDLPWDAKLMRVSSHDYLVIEDFLVGTLYDGEECVLDEYLLEVEGQAGGLFSNETESAAFNPSSFAATGTELSALGQEVQWLGFFLIEATGPRAGQSLTVW